MKMHRRSQFVAAALLGTLSASAGTANAALYISEYLANPAGNDTNQEWVELIATSAIDFAVTPYSVVFANNGNATASGWIAGGALTYGFSITSGSVQAGDVVYVGGSGMAPTGTKLRTIDVTTTVGDRFGSSNTTAGVLGNGGTNADAIGVFDVGINALTNSTAPIDAIFFGTGTGGAVVTGGTAGYQLPVNDLYAGGKLQSTSFLAPDPGAGQVTVAVGTYDPISGLLIGTRTWSNTASFTNSASAITPTAIPEPGTYALLASGLTLLGFLARRRTRRTD